LPLNSIILDDLKRQNRVLLIDFWRFWAAKHISRTNCAEFTTDRPRQAAYEIFSIKRRFQRSKSRFFRFKETCARRYQRAVPLKVVIFAVVDKSTVKTVQIGIGMLPITTNFSDERFSHINIDDFEKPELQKNKGFYWFFCNFRLRRALQE